MVGLGGLEPPTSPLSGVLGRARGESGSHPAVLEHWRNNFTQMRANRTENQSMRVIRVGGGLENRRHELGTTRQNRRGRALMGPSVPNDCDGDGIPLSIFERARVSGPPPISSMCVASTSDTSETCAKTVGPNEWVPDEVSGSSPVPDGIVLGVIRHVSRMGSYP